MNSVCPLGSERVVSVGRRVSVGRCIGVGRRGRVGSRRASSLEGFIHFHSRRPPHIISDVPTNTYPQKKGRLAMVAIFICRGSFLPGEGFRSRNNINVQSQSAKRRRRAKRRRSAESCDRVVTNASTYTLQAKIILWMSRSEICSTQIMQQMRQHQNNNTSHKSS